MEASKYIKQKNDRAEQRNTQICIYSQRRRHPFVDKRKKGWTKMSEDTEGQIGQHDQLTRPDCHRQNTPANHSRIHSLPKSMWDIPQNGPYSGP